MSSTENQIVVAPRLQGLSEQTAKGVPEIAEKCGVTVQSVYRWLNGSERPNMKRIEQMAELFGVSPWEILQPPEKKEPAPANEDRPGLAVNTDTRHSAQESVQIRQQPPSASGVSHESPLLILELAGEEVYRIDLIGRGRDSYIVIPLALKQGAREGPAS